MMSKVWQTAEMKRTWRDYQARKPPSSHKDDRRDISSKRLVEWDTRKEDK